MKLEHDKNGYVKENPIKQLVTCKHGLQGDCWWCKAITDKPLVEQVKILEERVCVLKDFISMVLIPLLSGKIGGGGYAVSTGAGVDRRLIESGADASKPGANHQFAFWYATDTDKIYKWEESQWKDIRISRPDAAGEMEITDIVADPINEQIIVTHSD